MRYLTGSVKHDPDTLAVAVRTEFAENDDKAWGVMTVDHGGATRPPTAGKSN